MLNYYYSPDNDSNNPCSLFNWIYAHNGQVKLAHGCDFSGNDFSELQSKGGEECGALCIAESRCTHFTYRDYGVCYLKAPQKKDVVANPSVPGSVCGYTTGLVLDPNFHWQDGNSGRVTWANGCDFPGHDFNQFTNGSGDCISHCLADSRCTHFVWLDGYENSCNLKRAKKPVTSKLPYEGICGFVVARV